MDFLKKIPLKNLKECATVATVTFVLLYIISSFIMPKILPVIEGATNNDKEGEVTEEGGEGEKTEEGGEGEEGEEDKEDKEGDSEPPPANGEGHPMYVVPNSPNAPTVSCDTELREDVCDFPPKITSAADACKNIQETKAKMQAAADMVEDLTMMNPVSAIASIAKGIVGDENLKQTLTTIVNESSDSKTIEENESKCNNAIASVQQNILEFDGEKCMNAFMDKAAEMGYSEKLVEVMLPQMVPKVNITGFSQEIKDSVEQSCKMHNESKASANQGSSLQQAAIQSAMQDLEGSGSIKADVESCNAIDRSQTACAYVKSTLCCNNVKQSLQQNVLDIGCAHVTMKDSKQNIDTSSIQSCDLSNAQEVETEQKQETTVETKQTTEQKATPNYALYIAGSVGTIVFGIIAYMYLKSKKGNTVVIPSNMQLPPTVQR